MTRVYGDDDRRVDGKGCIIACLAMMASAALIVLLLYWAYTVMH